MHGAEGQRAQVLRGGRETDVWGEMTQQPRRSFVAKMTRGGAWKEPDEPGPLWEPVTVTYVWSHTQSEAGRMAPWLGLALGSPT